MQYPYPYPKLSRLSRLTREISSLHPCKPCDKRQRPQAPKIHNFQTIFKSPRCLLITLLKLVNESKCTLKKRGAIFYVSVLPLSSFISCRCCVTASLYIFTGNYENYGKYMYAITGFYKQIIFNLTS